MDPTFVGFYIFFYLFIMWGCFVTSLYNHFSKHLYSLENELKKIYPPTVWELFDESSNDSDRSSNDSDSSSNDSDRSSNDSDSSSNDSDSNESIESTDFPNLILSKSDYSNLVNDGYINNIYNWVFGYKYKI